MFDCKNHENFCLMKSSRNTVFIHNFFLSAILVYNYKVCADSVNHYVRYCTLFSITNWLRYQQFGIFLRMLHQPSPIMLKTPLIPVIIERERRKMRKEKWGWRREGKVFFAKYLKVDSIRTKPGQFCQYILLQLFLIHAFLKLVALCFCHELGPHKSRKNSCRSRTM